MLGFCCQSFSFKAHRTPILPANCNNPLPIESLLASTYVRYFNCLDDFLFLAGDTQFDPEHGSPGLRSAMAHLFEPHQIDAARRGDTTHNQYRLRSTHSVGQREQVSQSESNFGFSEFARESTGKSLGFLAQFSRMGDLAIYPLGFTIVGF